MKTALVIVYLLVCPCFAFASDPARFWAAAKPARRSAWVVTEQGTQTVTPVAPAAKSCPCSDQCACGCNTGKSCACGNSATQLAPVAAPPVYYYQPSYQQFSGGACVGGR